MMKRFFLIILLALFFSSCANYYISVSSLKEQFTGIDSTKLREVGLSGPMVFDVHYKANPIRMINCTDKEGKPFQLANGPSIETRITYGYKNRRIVFYFDRVFISNGMLYGVESRMMSFITNKIPLDSIKKIEVQDGGKNYH